LFQEQKVITRIDRVQNDSDLADSQQKMKQQYCVKYVQRLWGCSLTVFGFEIVRKRKNEQFAVKYNDQII